MYMLLKVLEYNSPEKLLQNEETAFYKMVQSTGPANAEYLRSLVFDKKENNSNEYNKESENRLRQLASTNWAAATQFAIASSLSSLHQHLQSPNTKDNKDILNRTKDAVITLQEVLEGKHDETIEETLTQYHVPRDRWWSTLYKVIEGNHNNYIITNVLKTGSKIEHVKPLSHGPIGSIRFNQTAM
jgi:lysyl-tRNA synthetase class I